VYTVVDREAKPGWLGFRVDLKALRSKRGHGS